MTINVNEQVNALAGDIDDAVSASRTRTMTLGSPSAEVFGDPALADYVSSARRGVESAMHALAEQAGTAATQLRGVTSDFAGTDTEARSAITPAGGPR